MKDVPVKNLRVGKVGQIVTGDQTLVPLKVLVCGLLAGRGGQSR